MAMGHDQDPIAGLQSVLRFEVMQFVQERQRALHSTGMVVQGRPQMALDNQGMRTREPVPERVDVLFGKISFVIQQVVQCGFAGIVIDKRGVTGGILR